MSGVTLPARDVPRIGRVVRAYENGLLGPAAGTGLSSGGSTQPRFLYLLEALPPDGRAKAVCVVPTEAPTWLIRVVSVLGDPPRTCRIRVNDVEVSWLETDTSETVQEKVAEVWTDSPVIVYGQGLTYGEQPWPVRSWILSFQNPTRLPEVEFLDPSPSRAVLRVIPSRWVPGNLVFDVVAGLPFIEPIRAGLLAQAIHQPGLGYVVWQSECDE